MLQRPRMDLCGGHRETSIPTATLTASRAAMCPGSPDGRAAVRYLDPHCSSLSKLGRQKEAPQAYQQHADTFDARSTRPRPHRSMDMHIPDFNHVS